LKEPILLFNASIVTMDRDRNQYNQGAVLIQDNRIAAIGRSGDLFEQYHQHAECIDLRGRWILPGLINTHVHTSQQLGRGLRR
jgi:5-methylthioadenosine/S-adenosylhomocysteine deaminase